MSQVYLGWPVAREDLVGCQPKLRNSQLLTWSPPSEPNCWH